MKNDIVLKYLKDKSEITSILNTNKNLCDSMVI